MTARPIDEIKSDIETAAIAGDYQALSELQTELEKRPLAVKLERIAALRAELTELETLAPQAKELARALRQAVSDLIDHREKINREIGITGGKAQTALSYSKDLHFRKLAVENEITELTAEVSGDLVTSPVVHARNVRIK